MRRKSSITSVATRRVSHGGLKAFPPRFRGDGGGLHFSQASRRTVPFELDLTKISDDVRLEGSRMELELVLLNLLKNAAEAVRRESHPVVCLGVGNPPDAKFADGIGICVRNQGTVSDEVFGARL